MKKLFVSLVFGSFLYAGFGQCNITIDSSVTIPANKPNCNSGGWFKVWFKAPVTHSIKGTLIDIVNGTTYPIASNYR